MSLPFPFDIFTQAMEGNWVAWGFIGALIAVFALIIFEVIVWKKLPELAKKSFINETVGAHNPIVAECLETRQVRFNFPRMTRNGFAYNTQTHSIGIPPKLWIKSSEFTDEESSTVESIYSTKGSRVPFYLKYSVQAYMTNPELVAFLQHAKKLKHFAENGAKVSKQAFMDALEQVKGEYINFKAVHFTFPIDVLHLKTALAESFSDSDFVEFENKIRTDERGEGFKLGLGGIIGIVIIGLLIVDIVLPFVV